MAIVAVCLKLKFPTWASLLNQIRTVKMRSWNWVDLTYSSASQRVTWIPRSTFTPLIRKLRRGDAYTPNNEGGKRPDRATPWFILNVVVGLQRYNRSWWYWNEKRRVAHYDYWSDKVRRSVLFDAKQTFFFSVTLSVHWLKSHTELPTAKICQRWQIFAVLQSTCLQRLKVTKLSILLVSNRTKPMFRLTYVRSRNAMWYQEKMKKKK